PHRWRQIVRYAGDIVPVIVDRLTGEVRQAQIFVAVMGASNFTYVEATWTQTLIDWIGAHARAFTAIGGVPRLIVPDNAKVAVIKACLYEPQINRTSPRWRRIMALPCCQLDHRRISANPKDLSVLAPAPDRLLLVGASVARPRQRCAHRPFSPKAT